MLLHCCHYLLPHDVAVPTVESSARSADDDGVGDGCDGDCSGSGGARAIAAQVSADSSLSLLSLVCTGLTLSFMSLFANPY